MNRRDFLVGIAATAASIGAAPAIPALATTNAQLWYDQWLKDTLPIFIDAETNCSIFGLGAIAQVEDYPYVKSIPPSEIYREA